MIKITAFMVVAVLGRSAEAASSTGENLQYPHDTTGYNLPAGAVIEGLKGTEVGSAIFLQFPGRVIIRIKLKKLPSGVYGLHLHSGTKCVPPFTTVGPYYNPTEAFEGRPKNTIPGGGFPNIFVPSSGNTQLDIFSRDFSVSGILGGDAPDGVSLVMDRQPDDYNKQNPSSVEHIACGDIIPVVD